MSRPATKAIDTYAVKRATSLTAAVTVVLAIGHHLTRHATNGIALHIFPIIGLAVLVTWLIGPVVFAFIYGRQDAYSLTRTIIWAWAAGLAAIIAVWTIYGTILITLA